MKKRYDFIARRITETLKEGETGVLFIHEKHMLQFPPDIEVFSVSPPALDEIRRWQRDRQAQAETEAEAASEPSPEPGKDQDKPAS